MREKAKRRGTPSSGEGVSKALWSTACAAPATTPSTLLRYSWARLDPERRLLQVRWSDATDRAGEVWNATKSGEEQEIVLPENIAASLVRHRKIQAEEKLAAEAKPGTWKRTPTSSSRTPRAESTAAPPRESGAPQMRFYDLRDTAATLMIRSGVDVRTVADILGHADPAMTLRRYAHVLPDMRERAASVIDSCAL
jgi:integrase